MSSSALSVRPFVLEHVGAVLVELGDRRVQRDRDLLAGQVPRRADCRRSAPRSAASFDSRLGANPPSSPTAVDRPALVQRPLQVVEDLGAHPQRLGERRAPTGTIMNSWKSTLLSAWAPPLSTFIIGTGITWASSPPR